MIDNTSTDAMHGAFESVPGLTALVRMLGLCQQGDKGGTLAACELVLEALVARKKISHSETGLYGRALNERRRRRRGDSFGDEMTA